MLTVFSWHLRVRKRDASGPLQLTTERVTLWRMLRFVLLKGFLPKLVGASHRRLPLRDREQHHLVALGRDWGGGRGWRRKEEGGENESALSNDACVCVCIRVCVCVSLCACMLAGVCA